MTKLQFTKKAPPGFSWHVRHLKRLPPSLPSKPLEEGYKLRREREFRDAVLVTLSSESNDGPLQINVAKIEAGFTKPAALMPSDEITHEHPVWLTFEGVENLHVLRLSDSRLTRSGIERNTEGLDGIDASEAGHNGLPHAHPEKLHFCERRVLSYFVTPEGTMTFLTPLNEASDVLPRELPRDYDTLRIKERFDIAPRARKARVAFRRIGVALLEILRKPRFPHFASVASVALRSGDFAAQLARAARVGGDGVSKFRRFLDAFTGRVDAANPPKRGARALVKRGHL